MAHEARKNFNYQEGATGRDPNPRKSNAYADSDPVSPDAYSYEPYAGDGSREGTQFADVDPNSGYSKKFLSQVNYIDSNADDYIGKSSNAWERTTVDPSRADRGPEF